MVMMLFLLLHYLLKKLSLKVIVALEGIKDLFSCDLIKRGGDDSSLGIVLADKIHSSLDLSLICLICSCKDNGSCILNLINEELTEVLDINLSLRYINNGNCAVKLHISAALCNVLDGSHNI